jgi:hypothetical protein
LNLNFAVNSEKKFEINLEYDLVVHMGMIMKKPRVKNFMLLSLYSRVFDEISFRENFAKLAAKQFSYFAKMRDNFREFRSFAKLP